MLGPQPRPTGRLAATPDDRRLTIKPRWLRVTAAFSARIASRPRNIDARIEAMIRPLLIGAVAALAAAGGASAQDVAPPPVAPVAWQSLMPAQQRLLQKFAGSWNALPATRQQALARGSRRWLSMTPSQRQLLRRRWQRFKSLPPEQQKRIKADYRRFRQLPPAGRRALRRQWRTMTPRQRRNALGRRQRR